MSFILNNCKWLVQKVGERVQQGFTISVILFHFFAEYIIPNAGLDESKLDSKIAGSSNNLWYVDDTTAMAESEKELKKSPDEGQREVKKLA